MNRHCRSLIILTWSAFLAMGSFPAFAGPAGKEPEAVQKEKAQGPGAEPEEQLPEPLPPEPVPDTSTHVSVDYQYTSDGLITAFSMDLNNFDGIGGVSYRGYTNTGGFLWWYHDGIPTGVAGEGSYIQALQIQLSGDAEKQYDVYYRATSSKSGQMNYAVNGELAGTVDIGEHLTGIEVVLVPKGEPGPTGQGPRFLDPYSGRLTVAEYGTTLHNEDGTAVNGWISSERVRYYFSDGAALTGWQYLDGYKFYFDPCGRLVQDVDQIIGKQKSYQLKVNKTLNCLTVYAKDGKNGYIIPVKAMRTSVGDDTPIGTFYTPEKYRWRLMVNGTYTQWATRITKGFLFHSITYGSEDINDLLSVGYNRLGINRSLGCVRLTCENAKWIYDNCDLGTTVIIYEDPDVPSPFEWPDQIPISSLQTWDPTDPLIKR